VFVINVTSSRFRRAVLSKGDKGGVAMVGKAKVEVVLTELAVDSRARLRSSTSEDKGLGASISSS
jgi:hypothetical protein